jgi:ABC-type phosphate/phosphonate transport system substrate-binding protein
MRHRTYTTSIDPSSVSSDLQLALKEEFLLMDRDPQGRQILEDAGMLRFARVSDDEYDPIREMERLAAMVEWSWAEAEK